MDTDDAPLWETKLPFRIEPGDGALIAKALDTPVDVMQKAAERRRRQGRKRMRDWYRSMMDCGGDGCGECRVCRRLAFHEYVSAAVPSGIACHVASNNDVDDYIRKNYGRII
jgi:hypothetical protein